jgi:hypothetical protein
MPESRGHRLDAAACLVEPLRPDRRNSEGGRHGLLRGRRWDLLEVGQRLLENACTARTGRHEEDGCWPSFE